MAAEGEEYVGGPGEECLQGLGRRVFRAWILCATMFDMAQSSFIHSFIRSIDRSINRLNPSSFIHSFIHSFD
jgi:hypothetical protein